MWRAARLSWQHPRRFEIVPPRNRRTDSIHIARLTRSGLARWRAPAYASPFRALLRGSSAPGLFEGPEEPRYRPNTSRAPRSPEPRRFAVNVNCVVITSYARTEAERHMREMKPPGANGRGRSRALRRHTRQIVLDRFSALGAGGDPPERSIITSRSSSGPIDGR